jgi:hypothetical protein
MARMMSITELVGAVLSKIGVPGAASADPACHNCRAAVFPASADTGDGWRSSGLDDDVVTVPACLE